ncbi:MAG: hypothetical protein HY825_13565 [Acidobacteria bacterium]|nr:hypothetical protein [Acidobacteriota bacterium]
MEFIFQSPKKTKLRSAPVDETDVARIQCLTEAGWKVVERIGEPAKAKGRKAKADEDDEK